MNALATCLFRGLHCFFRVWVLKASHAAGLQTPGHDTSRAVIDEINFLLQLPLHRTISVIVLHLFCSAVTHIMPEQLLLLIFTQQVVLESWCVCGGPVPRASPDLPFPSAAHTHTPCQQVEPYLSPTELSH